MRMGLIILTLMTGLVACQVEKESSNPITINHERTEDPSNIVVPEIVEEISITIGAIGDVLLHERVYELAEAEGGYNFIPMLQLVEPLLQAPDFMMANQESMPGGVEIGLSTYPSFNSPKEIASNLQELGIDMVIGSNNHTLDRGIAAIESTLEHYDEIGMEYVGSTKIQTIDKGTELYM